MNYDEPQQERAAYSYEKYLDQLHSLANSLEDKVRPFLREETAGNSLVASVPKLVEVTKLGRDLSSVVDHFEAVINRITQ